MGLSRGIEVRKWVSPGPDPYDITSGNEAPAGSVVLQAYSGEAPVSYMHTVPERLAFDPIIKMAQVVLHAKVSILPIDFQKIRR